MDNIDMERNKIKALSRAVKFPFSCDFWFIIIFVDSRMAVIYCP